MRKRWIVMNKFRQIQKHQHFYAHETEQEALVEAARLCKKEGEEFLVLETVKSVTPPKWDVTITPLR